MRQKVYYQCGPLIITLTETDQDLTYSKAKYQRAVVKPKIGVIDPSKSSVLPFGVQAAVIDISPMVILQTFLNCF